MEMVLIWSRDVREAEIRFGPCSPQDLIDGGGVRKENRDEKILSIG